MINYLYTKTCRKILNKDTWQCFLNSIDVKSGLTTLVLPTTYSGLDRKLQFLSNIAHSFTPRSG